MGGLAIAIIDYETSLATGTFKDISKISGAPKTDSDYQSVYDLRMGTVGNSTFRWLNTVCTIAAIIFLGLRNYYRKEWKNKYYNT